MLNWMYDKGFINDDAMREIVLREFGLPDDTPGGTPVEERLAILALKYAPPEPKPTATSSSTAAKDTTKSQSKKVSSGVKDTKASSSASSSKDKSKEKGKEPAKKKQKTAKE